MFVMVMFIMQDTAKDSSGKQSVNYASIVINMLENKTKDNIILSKTLLASKKETKAHFPL